jgi:hypothetical protein
MAHIRAGGTVLDNAQQALPRASELDTSKFVSRAEWNDMNPFQKNAKLKAGITPVDTAP